MFITDRYIALTALLAFAALGVMVPEALARGFAGKEADFVANGESVPREGMKT